MLQAPQCVCVSLVVIVVVVVGGGGACVQARDCPTRPGGSQRLWNWKRSVSGPTDSRNVPARQATGKSMGRWSVWGTLWYPRRVPDGVC